MIFFIKFLLPDLMGLCVMLPAETHFFLLAVVHGFPVKSHADGIDMM